MAKLKRILIVLLVVVWLAGVGVFLEFYVQQAGSPPGVRGNGLTLCLHVTTSDTDGA